jgi:predicted Rossmann fold nucleotide-binding protein DprA/Smf involved in DNA uptake
MDNLTQAVLLLTADFSKSAKSDPLTLLTPLTPTEWGRFALWLKESGLQPEALLVNDPAGLLAGWSDDKITVDRIISLLRRAPALAMALEKWQRAGLWVVTRADPQYPRRLKERLKNASPPLFFGCGNRNLLGQRGIAVVGARDAKGEDLELARRLGEMAADQGWNIVSGGARGIDESAMLGALERGGTAVGVLPNNLLRVATSAKYRSALMSDNAVLLSPFNPEAGFEVANAMVRNRYIYCLADAAVAIAAGKGKGGTWNGALDNLKHGWTPLWVNPTPTPTSKPTPKSSPDPASGSSKLILQGAGALPDDLASLNLSDLVNVPHSPKPAPTSHQQMSLLGDDS